MVNNAEKTDFKNAKAFKVWAKMGSMGVQMHKKAYIYGILRKTGHGMKLSRLCNRIFVKINDVSRRKSCLLKEREIRVR